ncbi:hypothetical protein LUD75_07635 [Epilithonimonas sp. JDS]|uniref:hypothetical protein n=1 Tax=Epilithonimonas sp. JDS TaxID=2902797 RepID=UPI001E568375|nr:hypothetical protein [Epilithonimonas sp. JDS]MCD9854573.1 hypothetical protein [Epilithonimonas sp. JDS]
MKTKFLSIFLGLLWTIPLLGQVQNDVKKVLATKDFVALKKYTDNLSKNEKQISLHWAFLRDLTTDFQEGVFIFDKSVPDKHNPETSSMYTYRVNLVTTKTNIVYYELSEKKYKSVGNDWQPYYETIDSFKNDSVFGELKSSFKSIYQLDLNENDLFITDFVYGSQCGIAGTSPEGRAQMDEWVKSNNKTEIIKWLKSANAEKQVYAVEGLQQLKTADSKLTEDEIRMINIVCDKNGTIYVCSGCIHSNRDIRSVTRHIPLTI